jgi:hypothetical protein
MFVDLMILRESMHNYQFARPSRLLRACGVKKCQEPVDRIWAMLALLPKSLQRRIKKAGIIDYSTSGTHEYWNSYLKFMELLYLDDPVELWAVVGQGQGHVKNCKLPSWCPDFSGRRFTHDDEIGWLYRAGSQTLKISLHQNLYYILEPHC